MRLACVPSIFNFQFPTVTAVKLRHTYLPGSELGCRDDLRVGEPS